MNDQLDAIFELPTPHKVAILVVSVLLIVGVYWMYFFGDLSEELGKMTESIDGASGLKVQIAQQEGIARNLDQFRAEVKRLDVELNMALAELPDKKEISALLARVSDKARDSGLEVLLFKPRPVEKKDFYAEVPVQIELIGTYHQVATFFDEVGRLERIVNLDEFELSEPEITDEEVTVKTGVIATAFRFLEESERPQKEDEGAKGKRRGKGKKI